MKKNRIFSVGALVILAVVLAGCRVTVDVNRPTNPRVASEWETAPGDYVLCDNFTNTITFSFRMTDPGDVIRVEHIFRGEVEDDFDTNGSTVLRNEHINGDVVTLSYTFAPFTSPYSVTEDAQLNPSAIIIVPNDPAARSGTMIMTFRVVTTLGAHTMVNNLEMPVWGGCSLP